MEMDGERNDWLQYDRYAVYGLGRSGRAACELLARRGKRVVASDTREVDAFDDELEQLPNSVDLHLGANEPGDAEIVVVSPGLKPRLEIFDELRSEGIPVVSEIDLAFDACRAPVLAITGTDGKTTTTSLLGAIAERAPVPSAVGGNIGTPLSAVVGDLPAEGVAVAEVSAFQLWSCHHLRPAVAGFTNVAGDHLDYFEKWQEYVDAKRRLSRNSGSSDWVVYNMDDPRIAEWYGASPANGARYGLELEGEGGLDVTLSEGRAIRTGAARSTEVCFDLDAFSLVGAHNVSNALCATAMASAFGFEAETIRAAVESFEPLPHRVERLGSSGGVDWINDSKATNVNAALAGLQSLETPYVAIVGGVDKGLQLEPLCEELSARAVGVVLIGAIADRLEGELARCEDPPAVARVDDMEDAVRMAWRRARRVNASVILSPACSSFDMFESYEDRGDVFRAAVADVPGAAGGGRGGAEGGHRWRDPSE